MEATGNERNQEEHHVFRVCSQSEDFSLASHCDFSCAGVTEFTHWTQCAQPALFSHLLPAGELVWVISGQTCVLLKSSRKIYAVRHMGYLYSVNKPHCPYLPGDRCLQSALCSALKVSSKKGCVASSGVPSEIRKVGVTHTLTFDRHTQSSVGVR